MKRSFLIGSIILSAWLSALTGQINEKRTLSETNHQIHYAAYSPDGKYIVTTGGSDNNVILWNAESGIIYRTLFSSNHRTNAVVFSRDGSTIYAAGEGGMVFSWDLNLMEHLDLVRVPFHSGAINALAISPDGKLLATGGDDKDLRIWDISGNSQDLVYDLKGHKKAINTLLFSPDGRYVISGSADRSLIKWDMQNGSKSIEQKGAHDGWIRCATYSPDGKYIATGGDDHIIRIWNSSDLTSVRSMTGHTGWVMSIDFTGSGNYMVSGGHDHRVIMWNTSTGKIVARSEKLEHYVLSVDASPNRNDFISSCLLSEKLRIWANGFEDSRPLENVISQNIQTDQTIQKAEPSARQKVEPAADPGNQDAGASAGPAITIFSPEPVNGEVTHDQATILIVGKADDPDGIQTLLVNRSRAEIGTSGVFQIDMDLEKGENLMELVAISNMGKMSRFSFIIHCTDDLARHPGEAPAGADRGVYHALIIGVDEYIDDDLDDLDYPLADADSLYNALINHYSFKEDNITVLRNPDRTDIIIAMDELSDRVSPEDNLLIFYAGHGYWDEKAGIGYWLPHDAAGDNTANWFRNSTLRDFIGSINSKHTLLIADACFSGSIFKTRAGFGDEIRGVQKLHELPSRKAMTSGNLDEVPDKSVFVRYLIRELQRNEANFLPSEELYSNLKTAVLNNTPNVPRFGTIQNVGDEGGDFIFVKK